MGFMENVKKGLRSWLEIQPSERFEVNIQDCFDFELNAIRNRIWYRGDSDELDQFYKQTISGADRYKFWASSCTPGMEMRKIHTGIPALEVKLLSSIVMQDMIGIEVSEGVLNDIWSKISTENKFVKQLEKVIKDMLYIGDGAYKVSFDQSISVYPILEWYPGDRIEVKYNRGRLEEVTFKTLYHEKGKQNYTLYERYGYGYIRNELYRGDTLIDYHEYERTKDLVDVTFDKSIILAKHMKIYESSKWEHRGQSIYDGKIDNFDALDETWSQWMDAVRTGRAKTYIPDALIPRDPTTGMIRKPNPFDNRYINTDTSMSEGSDIKITTDQPEIPHDSYLAAYATALDMCLQGIISPSTLGIDTKKLDNAEAQREKEKTTLYTRNAIIEALQELIPEVVEMAIDAHCIASSIPIKPVDASITFGEYANPSFESQIETIAKGKQGGILSIEASVDELYGDSKDDKWKKEEVARLKSEQGLVEVEEPAVAMSAGPFETMIEGDAVES